MFFNTITVVRYLYKYLLLQVLEYSNSVVVVLVVRTRIVVGPVRLPCCGEEAALVHTCT
jgi:hypothetical protein